MAYADYSLSNTSSYETDEERKRREAMGQAGPVDPSSMYGLSSPQGQSGLGLQLPEQMQQQNMQMGQPATLPVNPEQPSTPIPVAESMQGVDQGVAQTQQPAEITQQTGYGHPVTPHLEAYQTAQTDPGALIKMSQDQNTPEWLRSRAREQAANLLTNEKGFQQAQQQFKSMTPEDLESNLRKKTTEGSWLKAIMYGALGMEQSAQAEAAKLGIGKESAVIGQDGTPYMIKTAANGTPIEGYNAATGKALSAQELVAASAGATALKGAQTHTGKMQDVTTGEVYYERTTPQGIQLVDTNGKRYSGATNNLRPFGIGSDINTQQLLQVQKQNIDLAGDWAKLQMKVQGAAPEAANRFLGEFNAKFQTNFPLSSISGPPPQIDASTGRMVVGAPTAAAVNQPPAAVNQPSAVVSQPVNPAQVRTQPVTIGGGGGATPAQREANLAINKKQAEENINVAGVRSQAFNKILDEEIRPQAQNGDVVSSVRKQQFTMFERPGVDANKIFGLYNAAQENPTDQKLSILRDIFGGVFKPEAEVSTRLAQLNLSPQERSMLAEYNISNQRINAATLKQTAGPGSVSDAEQKANRESNVDPTKVPALGAYNAMAQSQFNGDLARYKGDWAESHPAQNALQLDKAWRKEQATLAQVYGDIAKKRAEYISANGATTAAVQQGYKKYPVPEYDPNSGTWKKTKPLAEIYGR
jgi:hypothetical protein